MVGALEDHWLEFGPPAYQMIASFIGFKGKAPARPGDEVADPQHSREAFQDFLSTLPGGPR